MTEALILAATFITFTHSAAHLAILAGYVIAPIRVAQAILQFFHISLLTVVGAAVFFLTCGLTHLGLLIGQSTSPFITVTDHIQGIGIWVFLLALARDVFRTTIRLRAAYSFIQNELGEDTGRWVCRTIEDALHRKGGWQGARGGR